MNGDTKWALIALGSLVLWLPAFLATLNGDLDLTAGAMRYLVALAVAWLAVGAFASLVGGYRQGEKTADGSPRRRRQDHDTREDDEAVVDLDETEPDDEGGASDLKSDAPASG
jgi:hypothetical protein